MPLITFQPDAATTDAILQAIAAEYSLSLTDIAAQHNTTIEAHKSIEVAIAIDIGKGGFGRKPHISETEGVGAGGGKLGIGGSACVAVEQCIAENLAHKSIEVAIAIDIGKGGYGKIPHTTQTEGVGNNV